ncbi:MAG: OprO/OprP family phosphate-selective porin, partial [Planctomycetales bacterium]
MQRQIPLLLLVVMGCATAAGIVADAQEPTRSPREDELLERLRSAEQRIQQLETAPSATVFPAGARGGEGDSVGRRLTELENAWDANAKEAAEKKSSRAGKPTLKINGRIHADYWNFTDDSPGIGFFENSDPADADFGVDPEDRLFFRRIRLKFEGDVFGTMDYRMQIDFNTPDSGEMKDVYIGFKELPVLGTVLFGNQKRPLGLDHLNSSRFNVFIERPLVVEAFNEDARRLGVAAYNHSEDEAYHWRYGVYALENMVRDGKVIGDSMQLSANARLSSSPWYDESSGGRGYFHWAISGMAARPDGDAGAMDANANEGRFRTRGELRSNSRWIDTGRVPGADAYEIVGLETILNLGRLQFVGEYQSSWMQRDAVTAGTGPDLHFHG